MAYIKQPDGSLAVIDDASELLAQLKALPKASRPVFLSTTSPEVKAYLASTQAE